MEINTSVDKSTAFEATQVAAVDRTNEELENETSNFEELLNKTEKSEEISYKTAIQNDDSVTTTFIDPTNGKMVAVSLDKNVISNLKEYFGEDDVYTSENGTVKLDNKAESYVSGWFEDIAYKRDFLKADANNDGQLTKEEYNQTKNNFEALVKVSVKSQDKLEVNIEESVNKAYINPYESDTHTSLYRSNDMATSLDDELNMTLKIDKDFNSKVDMEEAYSTNEKMTKDELLMAHVNSLNIEDIVRSKAVGQSDNPNASDLNDLSLQLNDVFSLIIALLLNSDDEKTKQILTKLKENDGDSSILNDIEKDILNNVLKLSPGEDGKYKMDEIDKTLKLFELYELKGKPLDEGKDTIETTTDKTEV